MPCWIAVALYVISANEKCGLSCPSGSGGGCSCFSMAAAISPSTTCRSSHLTMSLWLIIVLSPPHEAADEHHRRRHRCRHHLGQPSRLVALETALGRVEPHNAADVAQQDH